MCIYSGKCVTDKTKHRDVKYVDPTEASKLVNDKRFRHMTELTPDCYEVEMAKQIIQLDLPHQIGFFVYQYAKLRMLEFYYDFIDIFVDRRDYQYCEMDTDSAYFAISGDSLEAVIKPHMKERFYQEWDQWLPAQACDTHTQDFVQAKCNKATWQPLSCCLARQKFDKRTPGLFKEEWSGAGFIGLASKTYYCFGETNKTSCKGINKRQNELDKARYMSVLTEQKSGSGVNKGFRVMNNKVFTYNQIRNGLSYFYPKRIVLPDGVTTQPLLV